MHKRLVDEILMLEDMNSKKSIKQVADILGITEKTVRTDIKEIDTPSNKTTWTDRCDKREYNCKCYIFTSD